MFSRTGDQRSSRQGLESELKLKLSAADDACGESRLNMGGIQRKSR